MILPHRSARFYSRRIMAPSPRNFLNNGRDIPVTAEDTEEYFHDDLVYFRKNVGDLSLLEGTTVYHDTPWATAVTIRYYSKEAQETYSDYLPITVKDGHYRLDLRWKY